MNLPCVFSEHLKLRDSRSYKSDAMFSKFQGFVLYLNHSLNSSLCEKLKKADVVHPFVYKLVQKVN